MRVAITSQGKTADSYIDQRFGRSKYFIIYDTETKEYLVKENKQNLNAVQGAGIQSGQNIIDSGADVLITGHCGPKAFRVLSAGNVKIAFGIPGRTVKESIDDFEKNKLTFGDSANVEGHWV